MKIQSYERGSSTIHANRLNRIFNDPALFFENLDRVLLGKQPVDQRLTTLVPLPRNLAPNAVSEVDETGPLA